MLGELLLDYLEPLPGITDVALCDNAFLPANSVHGPYLYADHPAMAQAERVPLTGVAAAARHSVAVV